MITRRALLQRGALLGAAAYGLDRLELLAPPAGAATPRFSRPLPSLPVLAGPDITLQAAAADVQILDGAPTRMWTFNGSFPGPVIRRPSGQETRLTVAHALPEAGPLTIHHHGSHSAPEHDGGPDPAFAIEPGSSRTYVYGHTEDGLPERAATQWYHDHTHGKTGRNTWMGLVGMFLLEDELEAERGLPGGEFDLPLLVTDRRFTATNQLHDPYATLAAPPSDDVAGDRVLVNGAPEPYLDTAARKYRLRILNASNFKPYNLRFTDDREFQLIGTESGLLPAPVSATRALIGPGERVELVVDFAGDIGTDVVLESTGRDDTALGTDPHYGPVMQFRVNRTAVDDSQVPTALRPLPDWASTLSQDSDRIWLFSLGVDAAGKTAWTINGRPFDHTRVDAQPELGSAETWTLINAGPTEMSHWIHIHDVDWKVLSRNGAPPAPGEDALKETFKLDPGEVVVIGSKFTDHTGQYMLHCHMLEHEDAGMMTRFDVVQPGSGDRFANPLDAVTPAAAACASDVLNQVERRRGRAARLDESHKLVLGSNARDFLCKLD